MNEAAQQWIGVSNREEAMARVLSRGGFPEGTVLHVHRAASTALAAVLANTGGAPAAGATLVDALRGLNMALPQEVADAAAVLDAQMSALARGAPTEPCAPDVAAQCLDALKSVRGFVNAALTH
jgi:HEPN domain-containing protein